MSWVWIIEIEKGKNHPTLPKTRSLPGSPPKNRSGPKRKGSSSNHPFSGADMLVSGRVFVTWIDMTCLNWTKIGGFATRCIRFSVLAHMWYDWMFQSALEIVITCYGDHLEIYQTSNADYEGCSFTYFPLSRCHPHHPSSATKALSRELPNGIVDHAGGIWHDDAASDQHLNLQRNRVGRNLLSIKHIKEKNRLRT